MSHNSRQALIEFVAALQDHLQAIERNQAEVTSSKAQDEVDEAFEILLDAFHHYEEVLDEDYGEELPFVSDIEDDEALEFDDDDDEADDAELVSLPSAPSVPGTVIDYGLDELEMA